MSNHDQPPMLAPPYYPPAPLQPAPMDYGSEIYPGRDPGEYLYILLKRKWWIIGTFLTIFLAVALYTFLRTPIFRTTATLQITQDNPGSQVSVSVDDKLSKFSGSDSLEKFQQTQYKILQSQALALRVIQALNLKEYADFKSIREENPDKSETEIESLMIESFLKKLEVTPIRNSFLVEVSFQSADKTMAQRVVNAIADEYLSLSIDSRNESFALVKNWLDRQLAEMAGKVQAAQKRLYKFGQKTNIYTLEDKDNVVVQRFIDLSSLLTKAQAEKMAKEAQYQQIRAQGPNAPLIVNHPLIATLRQQLVAEQAKVSAMQKVFRGGHPDLQAEKANLAELRTRIQAEVQRLQESIKADYEAANRTENLLNESFTNQKGQMVKLQDNLADFQILKRDAQTNEQLYQALLARVKEVNIAGTMVPSNVAVISPGRLPNIPFKPKTLRDLALAAVLGLSLGVGLAFLLEHLDDSIQSVDDLEQVCSLPLLGIVPLLGSNRRISLSRREKSEAAGNWRYLPRLQRGGRGQAETGDIELIVYKHPRSMVSEAIRHVYSSIMLSTSGLPPGAIMITSPAPGDGKTMIASNLAQSYALNERQVVLIDCDLRRPKLHEIYQLDSQPGLTNYLTSSATLEEIIRPTDIPNLKIITAGHKAPSPANLLHSETFKELLAQLRHRFQHILIDTPPVLGFADARFVSALVDKVLLVTRHNVTPKSAGRLAQQLLNQTPILGAVLNAVGPYGNSYGGYYNQYHDKYYSKYYGEKQSDSYLPHPEEADHLCPRCGIPVAPQQKLCHKCKATLPQLSGAPAVTATSWRIFPRGLIFLATGLAIIALLWIFLRHQKPGPPQRMVTLPPQAGSVQTPATAPIPAAETAPSAPQAPTAQELAVPSGPAPPAPSKETTPVPLPPKYLVSVEGLALRSGPDIFAPQIATLNLHTEVELLETSGRWGRVRDVKRNLVGWSSTRYLAAVAEKGLSNN
jgi:succinoglycan biosynthesis transport protein ExoP